LRLRRFSFTEPLVIAGYLMLFIIIGIGAGYFETSPMTSAFLLVGYPVFWLLAVCSPFFLLKSPIWGRLLISLFLVISSLAGWFIAMAHCDILRGDVCVSDGCRGLRWHLDNQQRGALISFRVLDTARPILKVVCNEE
jgi:hypothetical protein